MKRIRLSLALAIMFFAGCGGGGGDSGNSSPPSSNSTGVPGVWNSGTWDHFDWQ